MSGDFTPEQKRYLEGFVSGVQARGSNGFSAPPSVSTPAPEAKPMGPDGAPTSWLRTKQSRQGRNLRTSKWKREEHPFDAYQKLRGQAARDEFPKAADNFRWRYYGLFYVSHPRKTAICAGCAFRMVFFLIGSSRGLRFCRKIRRRFCACDDARQSAIPGDRGKERGPCRGNSGSGPHIARLGRRQHPQCDRRRHCRHQAGRN